MTDDQIKMMLILKYGSLAGAFINGKHCSLEEKKFLKDWLIDNHEWLIDNHDMKIQTGIN